MTTVVTRKIKAAKSKHRGNQVKMGRRPHLHAQETVIMEVYGGNVIIKIAIFNVSKNMDIIALHAHFQRTCHGISQIKRNERLVCITLTLELSNHMPRHFYRVCSRSWRSTISQTLIQPPNAHSRSKMFQPHTYIES